MATIGPSTVPAQTPPLPAPVPVVPTAHAPQSSPPARGQSMAMSVLSVLLSLAVFYGVLRIGIIYLPLLQDFPRREHMRVENNTFSPATAFIRMEKQNPPITTLTIDMHDFVKTLPENTGHVQSLRSITIINQPLHELPESIGSLQNLESLTIYNTPINTLPSSMGNLANLKELVVVGTNIRRIPDAIGRLPNIKILNFAYNKIDKFPQDLPYSPTLYSLDLTGNQLISAPTKFPPDLSYRLLFLGNNRIPLHVLNSMSEPIVSTFY